MKIPSSTTAGRSIRRASDFPGNSRAAEGNTGSVQLPVTGLRETGQRGQPDRRIDDVAAPDGASGSLFDTQSAAPDATIDPALGVASLDAVSALEGQEQPIRALDIAHLIEQLARRRNENPAEFGPALDVLGRLKRLMDMVEARRARPRSRVNPRQQQQQDQRQDPRARRVVSMTREDT